MAPHRALVEPLDELLGVDAAFRSLAASRGIEFADVVDAAANGRLRGVVEMRDIRRERRIHERNLARIEHLNRMRVLEILRPGNYL